MKHLFTEINETVAERMKLGTREQVPTVLCREALAIVKNLKIHTQNDVVLFCAALNLLNTYVKQPGSDIGYSFKAYINHLFVALSKCNIADVKIGMNIKISKKGNAIAYIIVQINDVQFSFHQIKMSDAAYNVKNYSGLVHNLEFDGLKKQICAVSVFEMAKAA